MDSPQMTQMDADVAPLKRLRTWQLEPKKAEVMWIISGSIFFLFSLFLFSITVKTADLRSGALSSAREDNLRDFAAIYSGLASAFGKLGLSTLIVGLISAALAAVCWRAYYRLRKDFYLRPSVTSADN